jgi:hypothetical protein
MRFLKRKSVTKKCEIPFCENDASKAWKVGGDNHHFCEKHFSHIRMPLETKKKVDNDWFTEERKRRMFNPTVQEETIMDELVQKDILELHQWGGKISYRPTERFDDLVAKEELDLLKYHAYLASMQIQMEEGTKIAIRKSLPDASTEDVEKYSEIVCPFLLFDQMDRDLNPESDRYKYRKARDK